MRALVSLCRALGTAPRHGPRWLAQDTPIMFGRSSTVSCAVGIMVGSYSTRFQESLVNVRGVVVVVGSSKANLSCSQERFILLDEVNDAVARYSSAFCLAECLFPISDCSTLVPGDAMSPVPHKGANTACYINYRLAEAPGVCSCHDVAAFLFV